MAVISEIVRGGANRPTGAMFATVVASAAASSGFGFEPLAGSNRSAFGLDAAIAVCTQALTVGLAFSRQASRLPPPARMHAMTIGFPTLLRQFSIAWLSSSASAGAIDVVTIDAATTEISDKEIAAPKIRAVALITCPFEKQCFR